MWTDYINKLFADDFREDLKEYPTDSIPSGPSITNEEIKRAIKLAKNNKAPGIPTKILKLLDDESISLLQRVFNHIYDTGQILEVPEFDLYPTS